MKTNSIMTGLLGLKEKIYDFYQKKGRILAPIQRAILTLVLLFVINMMFPYSSILQKIYVLAAACMIQAFLPLTTLFYIASVFIAVHLYTISFEIFAAFVLIIFICAIGYFRISNKYSYIAIIVAALFFCKLEFLAPAVVAIAIGVESLFPAAVGVLFYYISFYLKESSLVISNESGSLGVSLQYLIKELLSKNIFVIMLVSVCLSILVTSLLRKIFHERAWLIAATLGNASTACFVLLGHILIEIDVDIWRVILEAILGIVICMIVEFFRGIGVVSLIERTVFEDEEYIYYVKAVPKIKVAQKNPNYMNINEVLQAEEAAQAEALAADDELAGQELTDVTPEEDSEEEMVLPEEELDETDSEQ